MTDRQLQELLRLLALAVVYFDLATPTITAFEVGDSAFTAIETKRPIDQTHFDTIERWVG